MTAQDVYPKVSGDCAYNTEWNTMYAGGLAGYSIINISLENAMNITRLQFCVTIADTPHDYMLVDQMTDTTGYNNTVCTASTTSVKCGGNDLTGYYCGQNKVLVTTAITYSAAVKTVYFDYVATGTGTITYNILNATGGGTLCTGLTPKTLYTMTCCVACHIYQICQVNDAVNCLFSYAVAVGV